MLPYAQKAILVDVIRTWTLPRSNYVLVCPPMNGERQLISFLTSERAICEIIGDYYHRLAIASLDTVDFKSELVFAKSVARKWGVDKEVATEDDPRTILELACAEVVQHGRSPILIIHRFHEALDKLGEDIGSTLRDLEHQYSLKTVVTMPVSLTVLRERWETMDPNKAPFLASDWGQGHRNKVLKGYNYSEVALIGESKNIDAVTSQVLFKATGGVVDLVDILIDEIQGKKGKGLTLYLQQRSPEVCKRMLGWLDPINTSHTYKKALISLLNSSFYPAALGFVMDHDWSPILLNKDKALGFDMLAWAAASAISKSTEVGWSDTLNKLYQCEDFDAALAMIEVLYGADKENKAYWSALRDVTIFCKSTSDVFTSSGQWVVARRKLSKLTNSLSLSASVSQALAPLASWKPLSDLLSEFLSSKKVEQDLRIENFICAKESRDVVLPFLQLISLRLEAAHNHDTFQSFQSVMTAPESLLQIYAFFELGICYWQFPGLPDELAIELEALARKPYRISSTVLGYSDLVHLITLYGLSRRVANCLISSREELDHALDQYEVRKENSHSTAFPEIVTSQKYQAFLERLLKRYLDIYSVSIEKTTLISPKNCALELLKFAPRAHVSL